jgi:glycosyltransferase involved in cell wall biosynthesis
MQADIPRVSVILPFKNADTTLPEAIHSVLSQNENLELILIDNNPTPSRLAIEQAKGNKHIHLIHEPTPGIVPALNRGIAISRAKYLARMDADDIMLPHRLKLQADFLDAHHETKLVSGLVEYGGDVQLQKGYFEYVEQINRIRTPEHMYWYRFIESPVAHPSVMFRKNLTERKPLYAEGPFPEDYELWLHVLQEHPLSFAKLNQLVVRWNDSEHRLSRRHPAYSEEAFSNVRLKYLADWLINKRANRKPILIIGGGKKAKVKIQKLQNLGVNIVAISDLVPRNISGLTFTPWDVLSPKLNYFAVSLVSNRNAWQLIESELVNRGFVWESDFILAH